MARRLSEAVAFGGELVARLFAGASGVVPAALRVLLATGGVAGVGVLDGAQGGAREVLLIPAADEAFSLALSLSVDLLALLDALHVLGVPDALRVVAAGGRVFVLDGASRHALGVDPLADGVGAAGIDGGGLGAGSLARSACGVPGALRVAVA